MKIPAFLLATMLILLSSCTAQPAEATPTSIPPTPVPATITAPTPTVPPATFTPIPPSATPTETVTPTRTPEIIQISCPEIKNELPTNGIGGQIILNGAYLVYDNSVGHLVLNPGSAYLWDIKNDKRIDIFHDKDESLGSFSVSPNHQWLTYGADKYNGTSWRVTVVGTDGKIVRNIVKGDHWITSLGWLDNQNLIIWASSDVKDGPPFPTLIYNPFTRTNKLMMPDYPDIYWWHTFGWPDTLTVYSPTVEYVAYVTEAGKGNGNGSVVLWDINAKREITKLKDLAQLKNQNAPLWSPDGKKFLIDAILETSPTFELYTVDLDGKIQQLTHFEGLFAQKAFKELQLRGYSWSGDGRYIAFWYRFDKQPARLALLDTQNGQTSDLCIPNGALMPPVWSPDNNQLLVTIATTKSNGNTGYKAVLVNLQDNYIVDIANDMIAEGWLTNEP